MFFGIFTTLLIPETKRRTLEDLAGDWDMGGESITGAEYVHNKSADRGSDDVAAAELK
jgi:PHS family inorganic phosphate transporter-like MFS transporter